MDCEHENARGKHQRGRFTYDPSIRWKCPDCGDEWSEFYVEWTYATDEDGYLTPEVIDFWEDDDELTTHAADW